MSAKLIIIQLLSGTHDTAPPLGSSKQVRQIAASFS